MTVQPVLHPSLEEPAPTFLADLHTGRLDWERWSDVPEPDATDELRADAKAAETVALLDSRADPKAIDGDGTLPAELFSEMQSLGCFRLGAWPDLGGLALPPYSTFRIVEAAASRSVAVGLMLGVHNGIGVGASLLPLLPAGSLRDLIRRRIKEGMVSGWADTEPAGNGNRWPSATATPTTDGSAFVLHGDKLFVSNGEVADLLGVTVTVQDGGARRVGLAVVDTRDPCLRVRAALEYGGARGLPSAWLGLDGVTVPHDHLVTVPSGDPRLTPRLASAVLTARMLIAGAPALAIARNCLRWSREFVARRRIDGVGLGQYDLIQRTLAATMADVHLMDSVVRWSLATPGPADRWFERFNARNICTDAVTRTVDRAVSLLGGEGFETARSKQARGAAPVPLERAYRDVRTLRTAGGVDAGPPGGAGAAVLHGTEQATGDLPYPVTGLATAARSGALTPQPGPPPGRRPEPASVRRFLAGFPGDAGRGCRRDRPAARAGRPEPNRPRTVRHGGRARQNRERGQPATDRSPLHGRRAPVASAVGEARAGLGAGPRRNQPTSARRFSRGDPPARPLIKGHASKPELTCSDLHIPAPPITRRPFRR